MICTQCTWRYANQPDGLCSFCRKDPNDQHVLKLEKDMRELDNLVDRIKTYRRKEVMSKKDFKPIKTKKRCSVLNDEGVRCRNLAKFQTHYHGDSEIYSYHVSWVEIEVCQKHAESFK